MLERHSERMKVTEHKVQKAGPEEGATFICHRCCSVTGVRGARPSSAPGGPHRLREMGAESAAMTGSVAPGSIGSSLSCKVSRREFRSHAVTF